MSARWHILREGATVTLARALPVRFDFAAETRLPAADGLRLAHQVRQDMWRALRRLRGFRPVVRVTLAGDAAHVVAGGQAARPLPTTAAARVQAVLDDPANRARWMRHARRRDSGPAPGAPVDARLVPVNARATFDTRDESAP